MPFLLPWQNQCYIIFILIFLVVFSQSEIRRKKKVFRIIRYANCIDLLSPSCLLSMKFGSTFKWNTIVQILLILFVFVLFLIYYVLYTQFVIYNSVRSFIQFILVNYTQIILKTFKTTTKRNIFIVCYRSRIENTKWKLQKKKCIIGNTRGLY